MTNLDHDEPQYAVSRDDGWRLARPGWWDDAVGAERLREILLPYALRYFLQAKLANGKPSIGLHAFTSATAPGSSASIGALDEASTGGRGLTHTS